ncbi:MAG: regulatory protein RecX [Sphingomonas sp.]|jgi:regulatory protein
MPARHRIPPPLDRDSLDRLALRYVERFATTRAKLAAYLDRKIRERGWDGPTVDTAAIAARMAELGYVDDLAFAEAKARSMARRGLGPRRVAQAFHAAGIDAEDAEAVAPEIAESALDAALALARRKRIGPFAAAVPDRVLREKQLAQMVRGGHDFALARRIVDMAPGEPFETFSVE